MKLPVGAELGNILMDVAIFWRRMELIVTLKEGKADKAKECRLRKRDEKMKFFEKCVKPNFILTGWSDWWTRMEEEREDYRRMERNKRNFRERIQPSTIFAGWISWWNRMESEAEASRKLDRFRIIEK